MSFFSEEKGLRPLSAVVLTLLCGSLVSCSSFNMRSGFDKNANKDNSAISTKPLELTAVDEPETFANDDPRSYLTEAAHIAENEGNYREAASLWRKLIETHPDFRPALYGFSKAGRLSGLNKPILRVLYDAISKTPLDADLIAETAKVHYTSGEYKSAMKQVDEAIKVNSNKWQYYSLKGAIADKMNLFSEAKASYEKAMELSPDNAKILNNYAVSCLTSGDLENAEKYAFDGINAQKPNLQNYQTYAKILVKQGRDKEAEKLLKEKLDKDKAALVMRNVRRTTETPVLWGRR